MRIRTLVWRSVWSTALFGSLLAGCGDEGGVNPEGSESAKAEVVFEAFSPTANALVTAENKAGQAPERELRSASVSCPSTTAQWSTLQSAWNSNTSTGGRYYCAVSLPATSDGYRLTVTISGGQQRTGELIVDCNNGTWEGVSFTCDGAIVTTTNSSVCSDPDPVRSMWIGWYLADLKRCADSGGLDFWVGAYNSNAICFASNNYDGHGSKDACWRAYFRSSANQNGNSYNEAQATGHISSYDEGTTCGSGTAYPWANVSTYGESCKYKP